MGIWNTGASPIGYAYQSAKSSGIDLKPIDPRVFQTDDGSSRQVTAAKEPNDEFKNQEVLSGTYTQLQDEKNILDAQSRGLENKYKSLILNEPDSGKATQYQADYAKEQNIIARQKAELRITDHNAKMQYLKHADDKTDVRAKQIGSEIAIASTNTGKITSGYDLLGLIQKGESPFMMKFEKDGNNKLVANLLTYSQSLEESDKYSGLQKDANGRIVSTTYEPLVTKMNNAFKAKEEMQSKVDKASGSILSKAVGGEQGDLKYNWEVASNNRAMQEVQDRSWALMSEETRAYSLSSVLSYGVDITKEDGKPGVIKGSDAVLEIEQNMGIYNSNKSTKEQKEKALNRAEYLSDAIVGTAKMNVLAIANNEVAIMRKGSSTDNKGIIRGTDGKGIYDQEVSAIEAMFGKLNEASPTSMIVKNPNNGAISNTGPIPMKSMSLGTSDTQLMATHVLTSKDKKEQPFRTMSSTSFGMMNGVAFKPDVIFKGDKDAKIVDIGTEIIAAPEFSSVPNKANGWLLATAKYQDANTMYTKKYIKVVAQANGNTEVPIVDKKGNSVLHKLSDLTKEEKTQLNVTDSGIDAQGGVIVFGPNVWQFDMFIEAPSINATGGNNTINKYNTRSMYADQSRADTADRWQSQSDFNIQQHEMKRADILSKARETNPNVQFVDSNNIAYTGKTADELLLSIQKNNKLNDRTATDRERMTRQAIMVLSTQGAITDQQEMELNASLEKQNYKPEDRSNWSDLQHINEMPFDLFKDVNNLGNDIIKSIRN